MGAPILGGRIISGANLPKMVLRTKEPSMLPKLNLPNWFVWVLLVSAMIGGLNTTLNIIDYLTG